METGKIICSCYGEKANIKLKEHHMIAIKKVRNTNYGGCSLTAVGYTEEKLRHQKEDELITRKQTQNAVLKQLIEADKKVKNSDTMNALGDHSKCSDLRFNHSKG